MDGIFMCRWTIFILLNFLSINSPADSATIKLIDVYVADNIHLKMTDDELLSVFGSSKIPNYEVIRLTRHSHRLKRHDFVSSSEQMDEDDEEIVEIPLKDRHLLLHLTRNRQLMTSPLRVEELDEDSTRTSYIVDHPQCLYHGKVAEMEDSSAAISTCGLRDGEMSGVIHLAPSQPYMIRPLPKRLLQADEHVVHIVYKRNNNFSCGHEHVDRNLMAADVERNDVRSRRDDEDDVTKTIETAVFVDDVLYQRILKENPDNVNEAMVNHVFTMMNGVQLVYGQSSLSSRVVIVLVQVSVIKKAMAGPSKRQGNIEDYLESFCSWQARRNPKSDRNSSHWDYALMLSGLDLYMGEPDNTVVIGLAWVSGMCRRLFSCSINEGTTFESVFVISHELGHNLGMQHDGEKNKNDCSDTDFIMSSSLGPGKTTWSECSNQYLREFFRSPASRCLDDVAAARPELDHRSERLPGQIYSATVQCHYSYGSKYKPYVTDENPFDNVCRELWCANGTVARRAHPALDGTQCGSQHLCLNGKCTNKRAIRQHLAAYNLLPANAL